MRYLFYHGQVSPAGVRNVESLLTQALQEGDPAIVLCLASGGGDVNAGVGLYNFIQMLPMKVHTHAAGLCASIAVTILLAGEKRTAAPVSAFSTHAATFSEGPEKGQISPNTKLISQPFAETLGWDEETLAARFGSNEFRFGPDDALTFGLIDEVVLIRIGTEDRILPVHIP